MYGSAIVSGEAALDHESTLSRQSGRYALMESWHALIQKACILQGRRIQGEYEAELFERKLMGMD
jgi:hypothetical protein